MTRTVGAALVEIVARLSAAGIEDARREARLLIALALAGDLGYARPERELSDAEAQRLDAVAARRAAREPLSRIRGEREFWSLPFKLSPATLDPRPESETLVRAALDAIPDKSAPLSILDLGTGTGCLLLALLSELPRATGLGIDIAPEAVATARDNAERLGLADRARFAIGDWAVDLAGPFDLLISNPPYIPDGDIDALAAEVAQWDPRAALAGGADGLDPFRVIVARAGKLLSGQGFAVVELGAGQAAVAGGIARAAGLDLVATPTDLIGVERALVMRPARGGSAKKESKNAKN